jgi:hypothetical protein
VSDRSEEVLAALQEIRDLVRVIAEPAIAERDRKLRTELRRVVGKSVAAGKAILLMDGTRSQREIHRQTGLNEGNLSTLVKKLNQAELLADGGKKPRLIVYIPLNFFESREGDISS